MARRGSAGGTEAHGSFVSRTLLADNGGRSAGAETQTPLEDDAGQDSVLDFSIPHSTDSSTQLDEGPAQWAPRRTAQSGRALQSAQATRETALATSELSNRHGRRLLDNPPDRDYCLWAQDTESCLPCVPNTIVDDEPCMVGRRTPQQGPASTVVVAQPPSARCTLTLCPCATRRPRTTMALTKRSACCREYRVGSVDWLSLPVAIRGMQQLIATCPSVPRRATDGDVASIGTVQDADICGYDPNYPAWSEIDLTVVIAGSTRRVGHVWFFMQASRTAVPAMWCRAVATSLSSGPCGGSPARARGATRPHSSPRSSRTAAQRPAHGHGVPVVPMAGAREPRGPVRRVFPAQHRAPQRHHVDQDHEHHLLGLQLPLVRHLLRPGPTR